MTTDSPTSALAALPRLLRDDPAVMAALGNESGFVAVPEAARAVSRSAQHKSAWQIETSGA